MPAFTPDFLLSNPGHRPTGARLYHRGSIFSEPARHRIDRAVLWRIIASAEALEHRTREPGKHGGVLKAKGLDVLRALLRRFYCHATGECFPSYDAIAEAAGCSRSTVAAKLRVLEAYGFIRTIRRKVVASFVSRAARVRFDVAVQTSNSYTFNLPAVDQHQDADRQHHRADPLPKPQQIRRPEAESKIRTETSQPIKKIETERDVTDLDAAKALWIAALLGTDTVG